MTYLDKIGKTLGEQDLKKKLRSKEIHIRTVSLVDYQAQGSKCNILQCPIPKILSSVFSHLEERVHHRCLLQIQPWDICWLVNQTNILGFFRIWLLAVCQSDLEVFQPTRCLLRFLCCLFLLGKCIIPDFSRLLFGYALYTNTGLFSRNSQLFSLRQQVSKIAREMRGLPQLQIIETRKNLKSAELQYVQSVEFIWLPKFWVTTLIFRCFPSIQILSWCLSKLFIVQIIVMFSFLHSKNLWWLSLQSINCQHFSIASEGSMDELTIAINSEKDHNYANQLKVVYLRQFQMQLTILRNLVIITNYPILNMPNVKFNFGKLFTIDQKLQFIMFIMS